MRGARPVLALSLTTPPKAGPVADWARAQLDAFAAAGGRLHSTVSAAPDHDHGHKH